MSEQVIDVLVRSFMYKLPELLVCFIGVILAFVFFTRHRASAVVVLVASLMMLSVNVVQLTVSVSLYQMVNEQDYPGERYIFMSTINGVVGNSIRALALGAIMIAAFAGRKSRRASAL